MPKVVYTGAYSGQETLLTRHGWLGKGDVVELDDAEAARWTSPKFGGEYEPRDPDQFTKAQVVELLEAHGVEFDKGDTKKELTALLDEHVPSPKLLQDFELISDDTPAINAEEDQPEVEPSEAFVKQDVEQPAAAGTGSPADTGGEGG